LGNGQAEPALRDALWAAESSGYTEVEVAAWVELMPVLAEAGHIEEARQCAHHAQALMERLGRSEELQGRLVHNEGVVDDLDSKDDLAADEFRRAVALREKAFSAEDPRVAQSLSALGAQLRKLDRFAQAREVLERALAIRERALGPAHPEVALSLQSLGADLTVLGQREEALKMLERAQTITVEAFGADSPMLIPIHNALGNALREQGEFGTSKDHLLRSVAMSKEAYGVQGKKVAVPLGYLAETLFHQGDNAGAKKYLEEALTILERALGPDHPELSNYLVLLSEVQLHLGKAPQAIATVDRLFKVYKVGAGSPGSKSGANFILAQALWATKSDRHRAVQLAKRAREDLAALGGWYVDDVREIDAWLNARLH
jgi:eukaryotic-like serine/threonine-protein kinase